MQIVPCPSCGLPAEVVWSRWLAGTDGHVEHGLLRCLDRHVLLMPLAEPVSGLSS